MTRWSRGWARWPVPRVLGSGLDPASQMGPLVSARHRDKVMGLIGTGRSEGAEIVAGGDALDRPGYFVRPTVVANAACKDLTLVREEVFGPVVVAMPFDDPEAVLAEANRSSTRPGRQHLEQRPARGAAWSMAWMPARSPAQHAHISSIPATCLAGRRLLLRRSGVGREHGRSAIEACTEIKSVCHGLLERSGTPASVRACALAVILGVIPRAV
ncbi:aldehyde dehydrogenase family protein [Cupriavidus basilensis]